VRKSRLLIPAPVPIAALLLLAACSSSATPSSGGSAGGGATKTIQIMALGTSSSPTIAIPEGVTGIQAAAKAINDAGGINGAKIAVETCNDASDPNTAASCARQAVQDRVAAVIPYYTSQGGSILPVLQAAGIPYIGSEGLATADLTNPDSFIVTSNGTPSSAIHSTALVKSGCKKQAILAEDIPAGQQLGGVLKAATTAAGGQYVYVKIPPATTDFAPVVASAYSQGATCFSVAIPLAQSSQLVAAVRSSAHPGALVSAVTAAFPLPALKALGQNANGLILTSAFSDPQPAQVIKDMAAIDPKAPVDDFAIGAWTATYVFAKTAAKITGTIDSASVLAALKAGGPITGIPTIPTVDTSETNPLTPFARQLLTIGTAFTYKDGQFKVLYANLDAQPALKLAAGG
jgi:branched-chain amino acid transport system substrate-binding protein